MTLADPITSLEGVGPRRAAALGRLGIRRVVDLLDHLPTQYRQRPPCRSIADLEVGESAAVVGELVHVAARRRRGGGRLSDCVARLSDGTGVLELVWFNQGYLHDRFIRCRRLLVWGKVGRFRGLQMVAPEFIELAAGTPVEAVYDASGLDPVYALTEGVTQKHLLALVDQVYRSGADAGIVDPLPDAARARLDLVDLRTAVRHVHRPADGEAIARADRRLVFGELFAIALGLAYWRRRLTGACKTPVDGAATSVERAVGALPFALTGAQERALADIVADLESPAIMHRLLEGDVGSGKTVVAFLAAAAVAAAGRQAVCVCPTEILAQQHAATAARLVPDLRVGLLTADTQGMTSGIGFDLAPAAGGKRAELLERAATGGVDLLVGTHALFADDVVLGDLGLVIVDEQHRFGVHQRAAFNRRGQAPDLLVMTATPIPRSLALTSFGELALSVIDELPPGRRSTKTYVAEPDHFERVCTYLDQRIADGQQVFVVAARIESDEEGSVRGALELHESLGRHPVLRKRRLGLLHGQLAAAEKQAVVDRLRRGDLDLVVSTTVIEVGMDVPTVGVMVIHNPERYGVSQLHQLRGRVGRGGQEGVCILHLAAPIPDAARQRLQRFCCAPDGFAVAELDLEERGVGQLLGLDQHGFHGLVRADLARDQALLEAARQLAESILHGDPELRSHPQLLRLLEDGAGAASARSGSCISSAAVHAG